MGKPPTTECVVQVPTEARNKRQHLCHDLDTQLMLHGARVGTGYYLVSVRRLSAAEVAEFKAASEAVQS